jgi:hypothetical protein
MNKTYTLFLDGTRIGTSFLEYGDPPMGVVFGEIIPDGIELNFAYIKKYCKQHSIPFRETPEDQLIFTDSIPGLIVCNEAGVEISGAECNIEGMDSEMYNINILGIPYPFYAEEFAHHVTDYENRLKNE